MTGRGGYLCIVAMVGMAWFALWMDWLGFLGWLIAFPTCFALGMAMDRGERSLTNWLTERDRERGRI